MAIRDLMAQVERVRDEFHAAVFDAADVDAALALMAPDGVLVHLPAGTGARGDGLRRFLADDVVPHRPSDLAFRRISRTVDRWRVADETTVEFTHDRPMPWLLPGVEPTFRRVEVLAVSVVAVARGRITAHRTLWDHTALVGTRPVPAG